MLRASGLARIGSSPVIIWQRGKTTQGVRAFFVDRRNGDAIGEADGELLIGADGIHSTVRGLLYPDEGPPLWNGAILWRGVTVTKPFLTGCNMIMAGHEFQKFVCYPISRAAMKHGEAVINWIAERKFRPDHLWRREDWNRRGDAQDFLPQFETWRFDWLDVPGIIRSAERCFEYPMVDRDPLDRWTFGPVTLLGDAAHPMYPIGSNGASQTILDARVLAREIRAHGVTSAALLAYEDERRAATTSIVLANRGNGPEQVMQTVEERAPNGFTRIDNGTIGHGVAGSGCWLQAHGRFRQGYPQQPRADCADLKRSPITTWKPSPPN